MCGIAGWVDGAGKVRVEVVAAMAERLAHRGPDGAGVWTDPTLRAALGHRRLAIIDLSPDAAQPLGSENADLQLVCNGEIYNFHELRQQLVSAGHRFRSRTDSEILLHGFEEWGIEPLLHRLRGMYAFAIWDATTCALDLVRDRLGIKPLYYASLPGGGLAFASEAKALLAHPALTAALDPGGLSAYLAYGYVPHELSIFAGVRKLRPGFRLHWCDGAFREEQWWDIDYRPAVGAGSLDEAGERLAELLDEVVRLHMVADVPVGSFLSGGVDSSTITALACRSASGLHSFCVGFSDMDDQDQVYSTMVGKHCGTTHHVLEMSAAESPRLLLHLPAVLDEPLYDPSVLATYLVARLARQHVVVALSGTGGDEAFAGYGWFASQVRYARQRDWLGWAVDPLGAALSRTVSALRVLPFARRLPAAAKVLGATQAERSFYTRGFFDAWEQRRLLRDPSLQPAAGDQHLFLHQRTARPEWPLVPALLYHDLKTFLPDNCMVVLDRATMAHGLEGRVPLVDHRLVEWVFTQPWPHQFDGRNGKLMLKRAAAPLLPEAVLSRPKCGFSPPFKQWLREGELAGPLADLRTGCLVRDGLLDPREIDRTFSRGTLRRWNKAWLLMSLESWYRHWIRHLPAVPSGTSLANL